METETVSHVQFLATPWTVACQPHCEILQARILEWIAMPFSRRIFPTQGLKPGVLNSQQKSTPDARARHQQVGAKRRGAGGIA